VVVVDDVRMNPIRNIIRRIYFTVRPTRLIVIYSLYDRIIHCMIVVFYRRGQMFRSNGHLVMDTQSQTRLTITDRRLAVTDTQ